VKLNQKTLFLISVILLFGVAMVFSQVKESEKTVPMKETSQPSLFEERCSVCHSLERVRVEVEKIIKDMHSKAGVKLSEESMKEIENSFTLMPRVEPHKEIFQEKCATCHLLDKVVIAHQTKDEAEMNKIIQRMSEKKGSGISREEVQKIQDSMKMLNEIYEPEIEAKPEQKK
jgi:cytochrome c5